MNELNWKNFDIFISSWLIHLIHQFSCLSCCFCADKLCSCLHCFPRTHWRGFISLFWLRQDNPLRDQLPRGLHVPLAFAPSRPRRDYPWSSDRSRSGSTPPPRWQSAPDTSTWAEPEWPRWAWCSWRFLPGGWVTCGSARKRYQRSEVSQKTRSAFS